jgi:hypothetical protein
MSEEYKGEDLIDLAKKAEQDLNSNPQKRGENNNLSDSSASPLLSPVSIVP